MYKLNNDLKGEVTHLLTDEVLWLYGLADCDERALLCLLLEWVVPLCLPRDVREWLDTLSTNK